MTPIFGNRSRRFEISDAATPGSSAATVFKSISGARSRNHFRVLPLVVLFVVAGFISWLLVRTDQPLLPVLVLASGAAIVFAIKLWLNLRCHRRTIRQWGSGAAGERMTAAFLKGASKMGWVVMHDLAVPKSRANIDHLLVSRRGVVVIDSKRWTLRWTGSSRSGYFYNGKPIETFTGVTYWITEKVFATIVGLRLSGPLRVQPIWVVHGHPPKTAFTVPGGLLIVQPTALLDTLASLPEALSDDDVERITNAITTLFDVKGRH